MVERTRGIDIACHGILILGGLLVCLPIYFAFVVGSHTVGEVLAVPPPWLPGREFLANAAVAWEKGNLGRLFVNSFIVAAGIAVGKIAVSLLSAFAIAYFRFRYRMLAFWLIFVSLMLPVEVRILPTYEAVSNVALPLQWLIDALDLGRWLGLEVALDWNMMNSYGGLILPLIASATATFLFRQFFLTVPEELAEAARIDGASSLRFFWSVLLPLSVSNIVALGIILFLYGWNQYLWPLLFTTDKNMATA
ncbi:MAG TPA: ABC transporter permease subunit, partial [Reyranella sp.]|nr:ABC transporter permease subunit [Reyranella sp.]